MTRRDWYDAFSFWLTCAAIGFIAGVAVWAIAR